MAQGLFQVPVEAEDSFDEKLLNGFVENHPRSVVAETVQFKDGTFHYGFTQDGKTAFLQYVAAELKEEHVRRWVDMIIDIRKALGLKLAAEGSDQPPSTPKILPLPRRSPHSRGAAKN